MHALSSRVAELGRTRDAAFVAWIVKTLPRARKPCKASFRTSRTCSSCLSQIHPSLIVILLLCHKGFAARCCQDLRGPDVVPEPLPGKKCRRRRGNTVTANDTQKWAGGTATAAHREQHNNEQRLSQQ